MVAGATKPPKPQSRAGFVTWSLRGRLPGDLALVALGKEKLFVTASFGGWGQSAREIGALGIPQHRSSGTHTSRSGEAHTWHYERRHIS